jgi:microcystin-dependent protein
MLVTNQTGFDYWFGPLHLTAGIGQTLTVDDTSATSLYLTDDSVADAINNLYNSGKITVSGQAQPFPRPTGVPQLLHGDGSPEGRVFAPQGSVWMRRDNQGPTTALYVKTTGVIFSVGWSTVGAVPTGTIQPFGGTTAPSTDWLICDGSAVSRSFYAALFAVIGTAFGGGDGSTTFNLPDLRGRVPAGFALSGGHTDVAAIGNNEGSALANRRPKHPHTNGLSASHNLTLPNHAHSLTDSGHSHGVTDPGHQHLTWKDNFESQTRPKISTQNIGDDSAVTENIGASSNADVPQQPTTTTGLTVNSATTGISVGNPTSNPAINGSVTLSGTIGAAGTANDAPAYLVVNFIIKT